MPELPDITAYIAAIEPRILGQTLERVRLHSVFVLRTADPPIESVEGRTVRELRRIGKRIAIGVEGDPAIGPESHLWLVLHLMIAGRLHWRPPNAKLSGRQALLALDFPSGSLTLTEAGSKRRASLHLLRGEQALHDMDPGGVEIFSTDLDGFRAALTQENRTLNAPSPTRVSSAVLATLTPTRFSTPRVSRPSRSRTSSRPTSGSACSTPRASRWNFGSRGSRPRPRKSSLKASRRSDRRWRFTAASASPVLVAATPFSASVTPTTKPTTAPSAKLAAKSSPTAVSRACSAPIGLALSTSSKRSSGAKAFCSYL
jgi:hypothetical protein